MIRQPTLDIDSDVDFDGEGIQHGWIATPRVPGSFDHSRLPISVLRRGSARCTLLVGGSRRHCGAMALRRLARELDDSVLDGTVVILPEATSQILLGMLRRLGESLQSIVHLADPPAGMSYSPMVACKSDPGGFADERTEAAMFAFGAPESVRFPPELFPYAVTGELPSDVAYVVTALDGSASRAEAIAIATGGCRNVLAAAGVLDSAVELRSTRVLGARTSAAVVQSPGAGLIELRAAPGRTVYQGDPLALLVDPDGIGLEPRVLRVPRDGIVLATRQHTPVNAGDCVAIVAEEMPR